jgi:hypothetical protein
MRAFLVLLVVTVPLAGCALLRDPPPARRVSSATGPCAVVAQQRLDDLNASELASGYEKTIFDKSYQDCLAAQAKWGAQR